MLERRSGRILNVASTAAFQPGPLMAVYYATKAYVLSFSEALASETAGTGVTVTALCPGPVPTEFQKRAGTEKGTLATGPLAVPARVVAAAGYRGLLRGDPLVVPGVREQGHRPGAPPLATPPGHRDLAAAPGEVALTPLITSPRCRSPLFIPPCGRWFAERLGEPTPPQREGWPRIRAGQHTLIAAPTGSGKTLAAFLSAIDALLAARAPTLPDDDAGPLRLAAARRSATTCRRTSSAPLAEIRERMDPSLPEVRVLVRTGDTPRERARARWRKRPPHILVTTPESLYILLTSDGGRRMLAHGATVIVDEIHALARDKRGSHLALSLERLEALAGAPFQRIGLSATQKPLDDVAPLPRRRGPRVRARRRGSPARRSTSAIEVPASPLTAVCSHEVWDEIYARIAELVARAPHDARLRQHAQDGRAHRRAARARASGEDAGHLPPRQPLARSAASTPSSG